MAERPWLRRGYCPVAPRKPCPAMLPGGAFANGTERSWKRHIACLEYRVMAAARANWKGYLRLSLVSCPIALFPATTESEKVRFHQLNRHTGHRIKLKRVDSVTNEELEPDDIIRGYAMTISRRSPSSPPARSISTSSCRGTKLMTCTTSDPTSSLPTGRSGQTRSRPSGRRSRPPARSPSAGSC
jgi:hypothetical protein